MNEREENAMVIYRIFGKGVRGYESAKVREYRGLKRLKGTGETFRLVGGTVDSACGGFLELNNSIHAMDSRDREKAFGGSVLHQCNALSA